MRSVLLSIQPYWVFLIIAKIMGWNTPQRKTAETRKNYPKANDWSRIVKIYCSKDRKSFSRIPKEYQLLMKPFLGKVIGEFVCDTIIVDKTFGHDPLFLAVTCMDEAEAAAYCTNPEMYGWHISELVIYDKSKPLNGFFHACDKQKGTDCSVCIDHRENKCKAVTRPPQSWCYVEVFENVSV